MFAAIPLLILPVLAYNVVAFTLMPGGLHTSGAADRMEQTLFTVPMASGGGWGVSIGDLLSRAFATSTFFLLTSMVLLDVLAGFIVTIATARREVEIR